MSAAMEARAIIYQGFQHHEQPPPQAKAAKNTKTVGANTDGRAYGFRVFFII
ncbi:hypothetical protein KDK_51490 [Dictyobacter kobayashii]|uniref:Uncharacterized protein n=1 Tax=Dictyobacter kobayashii TaxID=2014872 RepID=A0A402AQL7_9CHLR|nr:hypothetical protein KDK_51490 [Dictyobacter kobayashii]